jgi:hypothetical protein
MRPVGVGETEISEDQLKEAVAKSIEPIKWFDEKLGGVTRGS